jgi:hypothetical protein
MTVLESCSRYPGDYFIVLFFKDTLMHVIYSFGCAFPDLKDGIIIPKYSWPID